LPPFVSPGGTSPAGKAVELTPGMHERRPALVFLRGELLAVPIPLDRDEVILGRALEADVRINDAKASRLHARISTRVSESSDGVRYFIQDLGSTNGTIVNGQPVSEFELKDGDKILIGEHILRFDMLDEIDREFQRQIRRLLVHDELTGLLTGKSFFSELGRETARAQQDSRQFCVLMMDIDYFKKVNDNFGHITGSQTLEHIGQVIRHALRAGDVASRFGGEEFAAFLLDAGIEQGIVAAERVREAVERYEFPVSSNGDQDRERTHHITISIGVAVFPSDASDPVQLVELADSALYRAKRSGRNRVYTYHSVLGPQVDSSMQAP